MADLKGNNSNKSRLRLKTLPFFLSCSNSNEENKSGKKFGDENGVVGLGIVVNESWSSESQKNRVFSVSPRSKPIPIFSKRELSSEEYTCVISHVGNNLVKKKEYFGCSTTSYWVSSRSNGGGTGNGVFCAPSPPPVAVVGGLKVFEDDDFLSCCHLCKKKLHGLDIFIYRGEKAFCSEECRYKHISVDEHKDKYVRKQKQADSPCSSPSPMQFLAGMAAA